MSNYLFANNYTTTLNGGIDNAVTTLLVQDSPPSGLTATGVFAVLIDTEYVLVSAVGGTGNKTWTVTRGSEGSSAAAHLSGASVVQVVTAGGLAGLPITSSSQLPGNVPALTSPAQGDVGVQYTGSGWIKNGGAPSTPEAFGAVGDGTTNDTAALNAWIGSGAHLALTPGKTYSHRQPLNLTVAGQIIDGKGASIKKVAQTNGTTATSVTSGTTSSITDAAAGGWAGFQVGDFIVLEQGGVFEIDWHKISSIVGNVLTIAGTFHVTFTGTTNVHFIMFHFNVSAAGARITNMTMDGNSSNWTWGRTWNQAAVFSGSGANGLLVDHCTITNQSGDGLQMGIASHQVAAYNYIDTINGRGICWAGTGSTSTGNRAIGNYVTNCGLDPNSDLSPAGGGRDGQGNIQFSSFEGDCLILGNYLANGISGVGSIDSATNSDITIAENEIHSMSSFAIAGPVSTLNNVVQNVLIRGNRIYSSGPISVVASGSSTSWPTRWKIDGNLFYECSIIVTACHDVSITNNMFYSATGVGGLKFILLGAGGGSMSELYDILVHGNQFEGGFRAVDISGNASIVVVTANVCIGQYNSAVIFESAPASTPTLCSVKNNTVVAVSGQIDTVNYIGIQVWSGEARGNTIDCSAAGGAVHALKLAGAGPIASDNTITMGATGGQAINVVGSTTNALVINNIDDTAGTAGLANSGTNTRHVGNVHSSNAISGVATLNGTTGVTVASTDYLNGDPVLLTRQTISGSVGNLTVVDVTNGSFKIVSDQGTDVGTVYWEVRH